MEEFEFLCKEAEITALSYKKENPEMDDDHIVYETMVYIQDLLMEEYDPVEKHLMEYMKTGIFNDLKTKEDASN